MAKLRPAVLSRLMDGLDVAAEVASTSSSTRKWIYVLPIANPEFAVLVQFGNGPIRVRGPVDQKFRGFLARSVEISAEEVERLVRASEVEASAYIRDIRREVRSLNELEMLLDTMDYQLDNYELKSPEGADYWLQRGLGLVQDEELNRFYWNCVRRV